MSSTFALSTPSLSGLRLRGRRRDTAAPRLVTRTHTTTTPDRPGRPVFDASPLRRARGWQLVERSPFGFVDGVAVTPAGVVAMTIQYHVPLADEDHVRRAWAAVREARGAAALMKQMLGGDTAPEVIPVLMLWGPGAPELTDGHMLIKGVRVLDPQRPETWAHLFAEPVLDELEARRLAKSLTV